MGDDHSGIWAYSNREPQRKGRGAAQMDRLVCNATVNREVELARSIGNKAASKEWGYETAEVECPAREIGG